MPCSCWYEPHDLDKRKFKKMCVELVEFIKSKEDLGDPAGISIKDAKELIDHIYDPSSCGERSL